jgi:hypothetical protein
MRLRHILSVLWKSTSWLVNRLWLVIDAPALLANHLFELASVWNIVRELTLSKQCLTSRSSRRAAAFVLGDLVFLSSKVYIFNCMTIVLVHFTWLINLACSCTSFNIIVDATLCLVAIVTCCLRYPLIKMNFSWSYLLRYSGHLAYLPWSISSTIDIFFEYDVPEKLLEQTYAYEHIFVVLSSEFFVTFFSQSKSMLIFWSRHLWLDVDLNNGNILILVLKGEFFPGRDVVLLLS